MWRQVSPPLLAALHAGGAPARAMPDERREVLAPLVDDIALLERLTGRSFDGTRVTGGGRGYFTARHRAAAPAATVAAGRPGPPDAAVPRNIRRRV